MIIAIGTVSLISTFFELNAFVQNIITMIGLAVGTDYALFIVARFREERQRGLEKIDAIAKAGSTAGRAVFFSGLTVVFALIGLLIIPQSVFVSLGIGAITVVFVAVLATLTLLPATLSIMGRQGQPIQGSVHQATRARRMEPRASKTCRAISVPGRDLKS